MKQFLLPLVFIFLLYGTSLSQDHDSTGTISPIEKFQFNFNASAQVWMRYTQLNPGSAVEGQPQSDLYDISLRRYRFGVTTRYVNRWFLKLLVGQNNWNRANPLLINFLDAHLSYVIEKKIRIGVGKSANTGLSRFSGPGTTTQVGADLPLVVLPTINIIDELTRRWTLFVNGHLGNFQYKAVAARPILADRSFAISENTDFIGNVGDLEYSAYVKYHFAEWEDTNADFSPGSYYGKTKVIALGAGFMYQKNALGKVDSISNQQQLYDMSHFAVDFFMEYPLGGPFHAITSYIGYLNYDFGEDYIRNIGPNNPIDEGNSQSFNGLGNRFPMTGTGQTVLAMLGYRFSPIKNSQFNLMPYYNFQLSDYDRLDERLYWYEFGFNFLWTDRNDEFTLGVQNRPIYGLSEPLRVAERKLSVILQYQIKI